MYDVTTERNCFYDYTRALIDALDRGGLIEINDKFFELLMSMEKIVKSQFGLQKPDLKICLTEALDCIDVTLSFDRAISGDLSEEKRTKLRHMLIDIYVNIRLNAYSTQNHPILYWNKPDRATSRKSLRHNLY